MTGRPRCIVISGAPCAGKSTLVAALSEGGFVGVPETARTVVAESIAGGRSDAHRRNTAISTALADRILERTRATEDLLDPAVWYVLDRALPDTLAYRRFHGIPTDPSIAGEARGRYAAVFILASLPFVEDEVRDLSDRDRREELLVAISATYGQLGYNPIYVPAMPVMERAGFVLSELTRLGVS